MLALIAVLALAPTQETAPPAENDPIVCKRDDTPAVGTHMRPKKNCMRKSDWEYVEKQSRTELQNFHDKHLTPGMTGYRGDKPQ